MNLAEDPSIKRILNWLMAHGKQIGKDCEAGDKDASAVVGQYQLIKSAPWNQGDPALWAFLFEAIDRYCKSHNMTTPRN